MYLKKGCLSDVDSFWQDIADPTELSIPDEPTEIYDPIFGYIEFTKDQGFLLNLPPMQRLRYISQLGFSHLVYPGATQTRFAHSLGVFHIAKRILDSISSSSYYRKIDEQEKNNILYAALLHDVSQFPFSHQIEPIFKENFRLSHEDLSAKFVRGSYFKSVFDIIKDKLKVEPDAGLISDCIKGRTNSKFCLTSLINGLVDADKIDYLVRDAHFTGVPFGKVDVDRIAKMLVPFKDGRGEVLAIEQKGLSALESLIVGRSLMYKSVYLHHTNIVAQAMLSRATNLYLEDTQTPAIQLLQLNDGGLLTRLQKRLGYSKDMSDRLLRRDLLKRLIVLSTSDVGDPIKFGKFCDRELAVRIQYEREIAKDLRLDIGYLILHLTEIPEKKLIDFPIIISDLEYKPVHEMSDIVNGATAEVEKDWRSYVFYTNRDTETATRVRSYLGKELGLES